MSRKRKRKHKRLRLARHLTVRDWSGPWLTIARFRGLEHLEIHSGPRTVLLGRTTPARAPCWRRWICCCTTAWGAGAQVPASSTSFARDPSGGFAIETVLADLAPAFRAEVVDHLEGWDAAARASWWQARRARDGAGDPGACGGLERAVPSAAARFLPTAAAGLSCSYRCNRHSREPLLSASASCAPAPLRSARTCSATAPGGSPAL